tara:strand:+ start:397 stop:570 length:174 start_codon:yes stop_codon:yes gene_type:complete
MKKITDNLFVNTSIKFEFIKEIEDDKLLIMYLKEIFSKLMGYKSLIKTGKNKIAVIK